MRTVFLNAQIIKAGDGYLILTGGTENMARAPYLMNSHRRGKRMGDGMIVDSMIRDGLWDIFNDYHIGITAENIAEGMTAIRKLGLDPDLVNINGVAIVLDHPIVATGARILVTLLYAMIKRKGRCCLPILCIGGDLGTSVIAEMAD